MPPRHVANFKLRMCAAEPFHLPKIVDLIGCNTQKSAFFQRGGDRIQKVARKNPATGLETNGKTFPLNFPATDSALRMKFLHLARACCRPSPLYDKSSLRGGSSVRFRENFCRACAGQARKESRRRRNQDRHVTARCARRFSPDQDDRSTNRV